MNLSVDINANDDMSNPSTDRDYDFLDDISQDKDVYRLNVSKLTFLFVVSHSVFAEKFTGRGCRYPPSFQVFLSLSVCVALIIP